MGVHGLWRLIDPSGKVVPLESLENKVLAVDLSIWLHQAIKGFRDANGAPIANAHLLAIYYRVCKLLYYRIKPVFVFDGGVPALKRQTIEKRNQLKAKNAGDANHIQKKLVNTLLKHTAVNKVLSERIKNSLGASSSKSSSKNDNEEDLYQLPPCEIDLSMDTSSDDEESSTSYTEESTDSSPTKNWDIYSIDVNSKDFKAMPPDVRYEILSDLKETRKQSSWRKIHEIPTQSDGFSDYQMKRLLKRQSIQTSLEEAEKEMGGKSLSLAELESLLTDQGVISLKDKGARIAKDSETRYLYIKDMKKAIDEARKIEEANKLDTTNETNFKTITETELENSTKSELKIDKSITSEEDKTVNVDKELDEDLALAIKMSLEQEIVANNVPDTAKNNKNLNKSVDAELEADLALAIKLSLQNEPSTSQSTECSSSSSVSVNNKQCLKDMSFLENLQFSSDESEEEDKETGNEVFSAAKNYMIEYSGLTLSEVAKIIGSKTTTTAKKSNLSKLGNMINTKSANEVFGSKHPVTNKIENITENSISSKIKEAEQNKVDKSTEESEITSTINETVEIMSDSDSSEDFVECPLKSEEECKDIKENKFEVIVQPSDKMEDDIFADIFKDVKVEKETPKIDGKVLEDSKTQNKKTVNFSEEVSVKIIPNISKSDNAIKEGNVELAENITNNVEKVDETSITEENTIKDKNEPENIVNKEDIAIIEKINVSTEELKNMQNELVIQEKELLSERSNKERLATNITDQMYQEAQDLLELFGVPYIIAPMEAEAQCAFLEQIKLTDGTITDDSDIWLFGGQVVYKNFFDQNKHVLEFKAENVQHHFKLTRYELILLALLVGSDYTTGLQGIGPVTALEILASFPNQLKAKTSLKNDELLSGLRNFKSWFLSEKPNAKARLSLRRKLKNINFSDAFPSTLVVEAYLAPTIDVSDEKFTWAKPDINLLKSFARRKFGWTELKSDEMLKPVIKRMLENKTQLSITDYFKVQSKHLSDQALSKMSKRIQNAIKRLNQDSDTDDDSEPKAKVSKKTTKQSNKTGAIPKKKTEKIINEESDTDCSEPKAKISKKTTKESNKKGAMPNKKIEKSTNEESELLESTDLVINKKSNRNPSRKNKIDSADNTKETSTSAYFEKSKTRKRKEPNASSGDKNNADKSVDATNKTAKVNKSTNRKRAASTNKNAPLSVEELLDKKVRLQQNLKEIPKDTNTKKKFPYFKNAENANEKKLPPHLAQAVKLLNATKVVSQKKVQEINTEVKKDIERAVAQVEKQSAQATVSKIASNLNKNEYIHQKEQGKADMLKNKLKAIETFRKSKKGPGYVKKRSKVVRIAKEDAGLSESSDE